MYVYIIWRNLSSSMDNTEISKEGNVYTNVSIFLWELTSDLYRKLLNKYALYIYIIEYQ